MYEADEEILYQRDAVEKFYLHADAIFFFFFFFTFRYPRRNAKEKAQV
jgi:hypothetical protein